ncbi:MAG: 3-deoxy-D-manno-octulosonic acid kinase [Gammaproteobacteria bacterium]
MDERILTSADGAILYDPRILNHFDPSRLQADGWPVLSAAPDTAGRGEVRFVEGDEGRFVLRHYHRGGLVGRVLDDQFLWRGASATRPFREFRLLARLAEMGLPVPEPAAAGYRRRGLIYRADLLTRRLEGVRSLAGVLGDRPLAPGEWERIGATIRRFHDAGVCHADLNAHNIQLGANGEVWLLDFDRGRLRPPGSWRRGNVDRLRRSLDKLAGTGGGLHFEETDWQSLLSGYGDR